MNSNEYKNIYDNESTHFYYVGYHGILLSLLDKYLPKKKSLKILDAGCGTGFFTKKLSIFGDVTGVDASTDALKFATKRGVKTKKASLLKLPFSNNYFDLVVTNDVICHKSIKDDQKAFNELTRVLKPGGILLIKLPAFNWLKGAHDKQVFTKHRYTAGEIEQLLTESNQYLVKWTYIGSFLVPIVLLSNLKDKISGSLEHSSVGSVWKPFNQFAKALFKIEEKIISLFNLPFGITIVTLSRKK